MVHKQIPVTFNVNPAYRSIPKDPTNKIKAKLITILIKVRSQTGLDRIHKLGKLLKPIVSRYGYVTYEVVKVPTKYLSHWLVSPPIMSTVPTNLLNRPTR